MRAWRPTTSRQSFATGPRTLRLLVVLVGLTLLGTPLLPLARGTLTPNTSGRFEVASQTYLGQAEFTVSYEAPRTAVIGSDLAATATVSVDNLTGAEQYVRDYVLIATLTTNDRSVNTSVGSPVPTQRFLYPGALWGPLNFSIPLTQADTGLSPGRSVNASLTFSLITDVAFQYVGYRSSGYAPVFGGGGSSVLIQDPGGQVPVRDGSPTVPFLALGILALSIALFSSRRVRPRELS